MTDRVVKVSLIAQVSNYISGMEQVARKTQETASKTDELKAKTQAQTDALNKVGLGLTAFGALAAANVGIAVAKWAEFDQAMSAVQAATHSSAEEMSTLRDAALKAGADTVFSATEAANAIEELAKAGVSTADILNGGLDGALSLASAGSLSVADAAGIASTAMQQFGLSGSDMSHVADLLAAGAGKAMGDVSDLSQALNQSGLVAHQTGLTIDETTAALAAFASQGLLGSDAGTSFKTMLQRLTPQSDQARKLMKELGISAYDASGNFVGLAKFAGNLQSSLKDLTVEQRNQALATIFGSDSVRAAAVLYQQGAAGVMDWEQKVNDSGYAATTAAMKMNNLSGDIENLRGSMETAFIKTGSNANDVMRATVQIATDLVNSYNALPGPVQGVVMGVGALTAAVALGGGTFMLALPKIAEYRLAIETLGPRAKYVAGILADLGKTAGLVAGITAAITLVNQLAEAITNGLMPSSEAIANGFKTATDSVNLFKTALNARGLLGDTTNTARDQLKGLSAALDDAAGKSGWFWDRASYASQDILLTAKKVGAGLADLANNDLPSAQAQFRRLSVETGLTAAQQTELINQMPEFKDALTKDATQLGVAADNATLLALANGKVSTATSDSTQQLNELKGAAAETSDDISDLAEEINSFGKTTLDVRDAQRKLEKSFDDLSDSVKENGRSLDITTEKGRDNQAAIDDIAKATIAYSSAIVQQTGSAEQAEAAMQSGRDKLIELLKMFGITGQAASDYADNLGLIPKNIETAVRVTGVDAAESELQKWINQYHGIINIPVATNLDGTPLTGKQSVLVQWMTRADGGVVDYYGDGGLRENHVAQIAPAGAWRVWAEPETEGESYIPLARSKRNQSLRIWAETGRRLGAHGFADGAVVQPIYASSSPQYSQTVVMPSLDGASITGRLEIGGDGMATLVDGQIRLHDEQSRSTLNAGFGGP